MARATHAVVLGGSLAGILSAAALLGHVDLITVVERDRLSVRHATRPGVPQARHAHLLMAGGARAMDVVLAGTTRSLLDRGAHRIGLPSGIALYGPHGWMRRDFEHQWLITCSRALLEHVLRERLLAAAEEAPRCSVRFVTGTAADALLGDRHRVRGVRLTDADTGERQDDLPARLVLDATGRGSRTDRWLADLGVAVAREESVDSGLVYASRVYQAPPGSRVPVVTVMADPFQRRPGAGSALVPIEDGRWMVTLGGTRGGEPPREPDAFLDFARTTVRHPLVGDLIAEAVPEGPVYHYRGTANRRRHYDRITAWPAGLVVLGDAATQFNPVYGHGMSAAARSALALRRRLDDGGSTVPARELQRIVAREMRDPWSIAATQDRAYPGALGPGLGLAGRVQQRLVDRLFHTATAEPVAARALWDTFTLSRPLRSVASPRLVAALVRGPRRPATTTPPLTDAERPAT